MKKHKLTVELQDESATIFMRDGSRITNEEIAEDVLACTMVGVGVAPAINAVFEKYDIEYRIVKRMSLASLAHKEGFSYVNMLASASDKAKLCKRIYFESETDFGDKKTAEKYIIWEAATCYEYEWGRNER